MIETSRPHLVPVAAATAIALVSVLLTTRPTHAAESGLIALRYPIPATLQAPAAPPPADPGDPAQVSLQGQDVPDPYVLRVDGVWYLFSGNPVAQPPWYLIEVRSASAWGDWSAPAEALADLPPWSAPGTVWSPDVVRIGDEYVMYYATAYEGLHECIATAVARTVAGPYESTPDPIVCPLADGGAVDPRVFADPSGRLYLDWKVDADSLKYDVPKPPSYFQAQMLSPDGLSLVGQQATLLTSAEPWQDDSGGLGQMIEAPDMVDAAGQYWLFYSGGSPFKTSYGVGVASCLGPLGPCSDLSSAGPWFGSNPVVSGPGEESLFQDSAGDWWMVCNPAQLSADQRRDLVLLRVSFAYLGPYVARIEGSPS